MNAIYVLALPLFFVCASCSSKKTLEIMSNPPGAKVQVNGRMVGTTPLKTEVEQDRPVDVFIEKEGYQCESRTLEPQVSTMRAILWTREDSKAKFIQEDEVSVRLKKLERPAPAPAPRKNNLRSVPAAAPPVRSVPVLRDMPSFS